MNDTPETIRLIFARALRRKPDTAVVRVRPEQLVAAFGQDLANQLAGDEIQTSVIEQRIAKARQDKLVELKEQKKQLLKLQAAGHRDSRRELPLVNQLLAKVLKGQMNVQPLVLVNVGELRAALEAASADEPDEPADDDPTADPAF